MKKHKNIFIWLSLICVLIAAGILAYPRICNFYTQKVVYKELLDEFEKNVDNAPEDDDGDGLPDELPYEGLYKDMLAYNKNLYLSGQSDLKDPFSYQQSSFDLTAYGFENNVVGYIDLPTIDIRLPILLGATNKNMLYGAVHLSQTSLPIGGKNTNCVLAAHRGTINRGLMFRNIHLLKPGDKIYITNFRETLTYEVSEIRIIAPDDVKEILIQKGRDLVTLLSCNPLGQHYQRIAVFCERVKE